MNVKTNKPGYILIMALLMLAMATAIVTYIFSRGSTFAPLAQTAIRRQKAKELALGGLQLAMAQINEEKKPEQEQQAPQNAEQKPDPTQEAKAFLKRILPTLNRWQIFQLKENIDGIEAQMKIAICCEQGKIDINQVYNFQKKKFVGQDQLEGNWKKLLQELFKKMESRLQVKGLFESFEKFLKGRYYTLNDVTELLTIKEFSGFKDNIFYQPLLEEKDKKEVRSPIYLTDVFTVFSGSDKIEPWLLSNSLAGIFGFKQAKFGDVADRKKQIEDWLKNFKTTAAWKQDWDTIFASIYGKELNGLPKEIPSLLQEKFNASVFSIISVATVEGVSQRLLGIIERKKGSQNGKTKYDVMIKRLYWL